MCFAARPRNLLIAPLLILSGCAVQEPPLKSAPLNDRAPVLKAVPVLQEQEQTVFIPRRLLIPRLDIDTKIEAVGKDEKGRIGVPKDSDQVAWYQPGAKAGETGNVILSGHRDDEVGPAVFYELGSLRPGDEVVVSAGEQLRYVVTDIARYPVDEVPTGAIFGATVSKRLTLITCDGAYGKEGYEERLIVFARQIE
ncbi:class F sortase [Exiguobacterium flavidum]|uniref:class F sortase n=1 Tax=Exiguobacterium flavidum TaxID=2184695 RepID=UPI000DF841B7|nr:class F sortase [Exiguobacterium flavidum]